MFLSSMMGGFFTVVGNLISSLGQILTALFNFLLFLPMVLILIGVMLIAFFAEIVFKKMAGIDAVYLGNTQFGGANDGGQDLVYAFITEPSVQDVFWSIVALSFVLLFIFTIVALIKSEFTLDLKGSAKGPIIGRALKSFANFIIVPVVTLISIIGTNYLTKTVYDLFGSTGDSVVTKCFYVGAYNANRARLSPYFASQLANNEDFDGEPIFSTGGEEFASKSADEIAHIIDKNFMEGKTGTIKFNKGDGFFNRVLNCAPEAISKGYVNYSLIFFGIPDSADFNMLNGSSVNFFYDLTQFDWILAIGSAICMAWILLTTCLVLVKRVFELTILFLLSPVMTAIAPLDGGQAEKKWRQEFMKRLLAVLGPIFAFNMYFLLVPLFSNISLFGPAGNIMPTIASGGTMLNSILLILASFYIIFDIFFQIVCVITGMSIVKSASALLSNLLGIEDLVKSGGEAGKKAVDMGKKAALLATGVGGVAVKGAAMAAKVGGRVASKVGKGVSNLANKAKDRIRENRRDKELEGLSDEQKEIRQQEFIQEDKEREAAAAKKAADKAARKEDRAKKKADRKEAFSNWGKKANKTIQKGLSAVGLMHEDVSGELEEFDEKHKGDIDELDSAKNNLAKLEETRKTLTDKDALAKNREEIDAARKLVDEKQSAWDSAQKERKSIEARGNGVYASEFGVDSNVTSTMARATEKINSKAALFKKIPLLNKIPELTNSWAEQFQVNGDTAKRRLNDGLAGVFGEGGGGDLWKIWFNKNARAGLYEGVPESKKRTAGIDASLSWGGKAKYDKEEQEKKDRNEMERIMRRMLAESRGIKEYDDLIQKREKAENPTEIKKLDAKIEKMEIDTGLMADGRSFYDKVASGDKEAAKRLSDYKAKMEKDAAVKAYGKEVETKAKAEAAKTEYIEKNTSPEQAQKIKQDAEDRAKMAEAYANALKKTLENSKIDFKPGAIEALVNGMKESFTEMKMSEMADAMLALVNALGQLPKK